MLAIKSLLPELKKLVTDLSADLLARSTAKDDPYSIEVDAGLREAYAQIEKGGRTADAFEVWREDYLDQVAVAWVLGCVFVRFMEDNHLIDECWLAGEGERRKLAEDTHELYFREHPHESDREYFEHVFHEVGKIPACRDLFAEGKTPLWAVGPSGDMAMRLLAFWREIDAESGDLARTFEVEDGDTRFLGDLYQDLSERARKKYALLQTPVFVEEFILDRTLDPAINEFGLDEVRMIDPTCGSGHFLLGGFARLFDLWIKREDNEVVAAQKALDGIWGCDINPFAVAIARFRLLVAAVRACEIKRLKDAPAWNIHLAAGDSLLFGSRWDREGKKRPEVRYLDDSWAPEIYSCEDKAEVLRVLGQQYHAVVGNPPYITPKDSALRRAYRDKYVTAHDKYHLSTPFTERFFELAVASNGTHCGYVGLIKDNAFMRRVFGKKLIEDFLVNVDVTHVLNTEGAYIPGHGTPTVILLGRNRRPVGSVIRAVYGIQGEPATPATPSLGLVWQSILKNVDLPDEEDAFTSSSDVPRHVFGRHPWSTSGGGASELFSEMQTRAKSRLSEEASSVGIVCFTLEDDVFIMPLHVAEMRTIPKERLRQMIEGDSVRDWSVGDNEVVVFPYDNEFRPIPEDDSPIFRYLWKYRSRIANNKMFNGESKISTGLQWYEYGRLTFHKLETPLSIVFSEIATHNHFALDRGESLFKQTAPIIKLSADATEDDYFGLLSVLNSSSAGFWLKQGAHNKGDSTDQHGARTTGDPAFNTFVFNSKHVEKLPLPTARFSQDAKEIDSLASKLRSSVPSAVIDETWPPSRSLGDCEVECRELLGRLVFLQEELDWKLYHAYELIDDDLSYAGAEDIALEPGQRAFEIVLAQRIDAGKTQSDWFRRHGREPHSSIPTTFPKAYQEVVARRIEVIHLVKTIRLIERPEFKRRWQFDDWERQENAVLKRWLVNRLTGDRYFSRSGEISLRSVAQLADLSKSDSSFQEVAARYRGRADFDSVNLVAELVESEAVPFLPALVYKREGLTKHGLWETAWNLQRDEDATGTRRDIKYPKDFTAKDYQSATISRLRGKLDVPKEMFVSFPHCETESDPSLVVGWAGWNHLQQATALIAYYDARKREGWDAKRLTPLLAGLDQLLPWIHQWHAEVDPEFGETAGQSFETMLKADAHELGLTLEDIRAWEPPAKTKTRRKKAAKGGRKKAEG